MPYHLGTRSRSALIGVHPLLQAVVKTAIAQTSQDFTVLEGLRSAERQARYYNAGVSKTMKSKHLMQADGFAHAVDLVPWIDGGPRWEWPAIYPIADAMRTAARQHGLALTWGGVWDRRLDALIGPLDEAVWHYQQRHKGPDFLDGPHYEIVNTDALRSV